MTKLRHWAFSLLLLAGTCALSACLPEVFAQKADYKLNGLEKQVSLNDDVKKFLDNRAAEITPLKPSNPDAAYYEAAKSRSLRDDLKAYMDSKGYFDSNVNFSAGQKPWSGVYKVTSGEQYKIADISVSPGIYAGHMKTLQKGQVLDAEKALLAQRQLHDDIAHGKCFFALDVENEVTLDRKAKTASIAFKVTAAGQSTFGNLTFEGNKDVQEAYLRKLPNWKAGDCFDRARLEELRVALFESGLFSAVDFQLPDARPRNGRVPVTVRVTERAPRTISAGVSYYSDEGPGVTLGWKHRNLFGQAESLDTELTLSPILQKLSGTLTKPFFLRKDQQIALNAALKREDTDGYLTTGIESGLTLSRKFSKRLSGSSGAKLSFKKIEDEVTRQTDDFLLLSFPQGLIYDSRDNALDATKGWLLNGNVEPYIAAVGDKPLFLKTEFSARKYHAVGKNVVLAGRAKIGSILGPATASLPATERFYSGGGGSVRGFGYQEVGPVRNGSPEGGRSIIEGSAEARFKFNDTLGAVAFVDAGEVNNGLFPDMGDLSVGAGVGLRYYTGFGPLRLDVAVPVTNKETASSAYQVYLSIGQAF